MLPMGKFTFYTCLLKKCRTEQQQLLLNKYIFNKKGWKSEEVYIRFGRYPCEKE